MRTVAVWQATDTQRNRDVALKILPDAFAADPDRLARSRCWTLAWRRREPVAVSRASEAVPAREGGRTGRSTRVLGQAFSPLSGVRIRLVGSGSNALESPVVAVTVRGSPQDVLSRVNRR